MLGYSILKNLFANLVDTEIVRNVYHSVVLLPLPEGGFKPAAPVKGNYMYVGVDDTKGFNTYVRQTGSADVVKTEKLGSCNFNMYTFQIPFKVVFYNREEKRSHEDVLSRLMKATFSTPSIKIQRVTSNPDEILRSESPTGRFSFKNQAFYCSIDFFVLLKLQADTCESEISCAKADNPYC